MTDERGVEGSRGFLQQQCSLREFSGGWLGKPDFRSRPLQYVTLYTATVIALLCKLLPMVAETKDAARAIEGLNKLIMPYLTAVAQIAGLAGVVLYVFGYVVVNVHLSRYGTISKSILNFQYIPAGFTFFVILGIFAFGVGVKVFRLDQDGKTVFEAKPKQANGIIWWMLTFVFLVASITFGIAVTTVLVMMIFLRESATWVSLAGFLWFVIDYPLTVLGVYRRFPVSLIFSFVLYTAAVWIVAVRTGNDEFKLFFWSFVVLAVTLLMAIDFHKLLKSSRVTATVVASMMLILTAGLYGTKVYEKIPQGMGGGKPMPVRLLVSSPNVAVVQHIFKMDSNFTEDTQLLTEDTEELILLYKNSEGKVNAVRLSKRLVDGVVPTPASVRPK